MYIEGDKMISIYDIQQLLKKFGTIIYTGDRIADLQLMQDELRELNQSQLIDPKDYQTALFLIKQEIQKEMSKE
ncbi:cytoplasmic protein [Bacillus pseudomycoides]|uniref:Cytoplasmic protein n=2 Tax=Bacillaceae TaxID=186817 RepID=A0AA91VEF4_9BACI|nr:cytoplasmic protein [Bacillus sp. AFS098217]PED83776.1 cytoplasmic protein [Bacillus pseudomycoides]PEU14754.1 cytoplasmic protein [Bacillus sp. AFS019443]PEU19494.1 cytoplasmic protein [Bacillus sp. AFS014408]PFW64425.1 cytoplasmic protein [Bacillus sp. AFS075034]